MALGDEIEILGRSELFSRFDQEALRLLAFAAEYRTIRGGDIIFRKGDRADGGYVVKTGSVMLSAENGKEPITVGPGSLIGRLALFIRNVRPITAIAAEQTSLIRISPTLMRRVLEEFPNCAEAAYDSLASDLEELSGNLEQVRHLFENGGESR